MIDDILVKLENLDAKGISYTFNATYQRLDTHKAQPTYELKLENKGALTVTLKTNELSTLEAVLKLVEEG